MINNPFLQTKKKFPDYIYYFNKKDSTSLYIREFKYNEDVISVNKNLCIIN